MAGRHGRKVASAVGGVIVLLASVLGALAVPPAGATVPPPTVAVVGGWNLPDGAAEVTFASGVAVLPGGSVISGWTDWSSGSGGGFLRLHSATGAALGTRSIPPTDHLEVTPTGEVLTATGRYSITGTSLSTHPKGAIAVAGDGSYYVATSTETRHYSPSGSLIGSFASGSASDIAVLPSGDLVYVKETTLTVRTSTGAAVTSWTLPGSSYSVVVDRLGRIHAGLNWFRQVAVYDSTGTDLGTYSAGPGDGDWMSGLAVAPTGEIYTVISGPLSEKNRINRLIDTAMPIIDRVSPNRGPTTGGTAVQLSGAGFSAATQVSFGKTAATSFTVVSDTEILATAPPQAKAAVVNVTVSTATGTSLPAQRSWFTYEASTPLPNVASVSPKRGSLAGGEEITLTGTGFTGATRVRFGTDRDAASFTVVSDSEIRAIAPSRPAPVTVNVFVDTPAGTSGSTQASWYIYETPPVVAPPVITSLTPNQSPISGGQEVTIRGTGFLGATAVRFGSTTNAASFVVVSDTEIRATTAPRASTGYVNVFVTTPGGTSTTSSATLFAFTAGQPAGSALTWGLNDHHQVGTWPNNISRLPRPVTGAVGLVDIDLGWQTVYALRQDGSVLAWGRGDIGQIGDGGTEDRSEAVVVPGFGSTSPAAEVTSYFQHAVARRVDGSVVAWGRGDTGQIGDGDVQGRLTPTAVATLGAGSGVIDVATSSQASFALKSDGTVLYWGALSGFSQVTVPTVLVGPGSGVVSIDAASSHLLLVSSDGAVRYLGAPWGKATATTPTTVPLLGPGAGVVKVAAGDMHDLFLKSDGSVLAWGNNPLGELGDGTKEARLTPVSVVGLGPGSQVIDIGSGGNHSIALKADGTVLAWGGSGWGQLGNPDTFYTGQKTPGVVVGLGPGSGVIAVDADTNSSAAVQVGT